MGNVEICARKSGVVPGSGDHSVTTIFGPRGLELIKSCAKFYANGVAAANPTVQLSYPSGSAMAQPAMSPSGVARGRSNSVAAICLFFGVLPSLALIAIVWWGVTTPAVNGGEDVAKHASALSEQATSQGTKSSIIIHKVTTQPIPASWVGADRDGNSAEISATD